MLFEELEGAVSFVHDNGATGQFYLPEITCGAVALLDVDDDGDLDLYVAQGRPVGSDPPLGSRIDRLYRNDRKPAPGGAVALRFTDVTSDSGLAEAGLGCGVATGDFDRDGHTDLYVSRYGSNQLLRNLGEGRFADVTGRSGTDDPRWSVPATFFDYDGDGWLDLWVGSYVAFDLAVHKGCRAPSGALDYCNPGAYRGLPDRLFRNRGDGTFEDVTRAAGLGDTASKALGAVAGDFDDDGRRDLYVANDGIANQLWLQRRPGNFTDEGMLAGCAVDGQGRPEASMGAALGDLDADLDEDLFLTHLSGETNTLYQNEGGAFFSDTSADSGLGAPSWPATSWGVALVDADLDGQLDVVTVSGAVRQLEALASAGDPYPYHQPNQLFRNLGGGRFVEASTEAGPAFAYSEVSRGLAVGDLDDDGDSDLVWSNAGGPLRIALGTAAARARWLGVRLVDADGLTAIGARAVLRRDGRAALLRRCLTDGGYGGAHDPRLLFGLGDDPTPAHDVEVWWPDGTRELFPGVATGRYSELRRGAGRPAGRPQRPVDSDRSN